MKTARNHNNYSREDIERRNCEGITRKLLMFGDTPV